jgi:signal transduction histidine kinase
MMTHSFSEEVREALVDVHLSIEALSRIIDTLELMSHDLSGHACPGPTRLRASDVIRAALPPVERAAASHGVQVKVDLLDMGEAHFSAGELYFSRALVALLLNAITAAPPRSTVRLELQSTSDTVIFRVKDDGEALDASLAASALSAAGQVEIKTKRAGRYSRGLGLYVVARCAELGHAELRVGVSDKGSVLDLVCKRAQ